MDAVLHQSLTQSEAPAQAPADATDVRRALDDELVRALGLLYKAPRGIPELALASLSFGSRVALEAYGLISVRNREDGTLAVTVTSLGGEVIKLCAESMPTIAESDLAQATSEAESLLSLADSSSVQATRA